ncbi:MAG: TniQ family protein [Sedimenticola sp.]
MRNEENLHSSMYSTGEVPAVLPGCVPPEAHENLPGYILRISEFNGYHQPSIVMRIAGYRGYIGSFFSKNLNNLSRTTGQHVSALEKLVYKKPNILKTAYTTRVKGHDFPRFLIDSNNPKICPNCIIEKGSIPWWWDLVPIVACPEHGNYFIQRCPSCGDKLRWQRQGLLRCHCGHDLSRLKTNEASSSAKQISSAIHVSLFGSTKSTDEIYPKLLNMPPGELGWFIALIGQWCLGKHGMSLQQIQTENNGDHVSLVEASYEVLSEWPHAFHAVSG